MKRTGLTALVAGCVALAACPHDFTRRDAAGPDTADHDAAPETGTDLARPDLRHPIDLHSAPDMRCIPPCVETIPHGLLGPHDVVVAPDGTLYISEYHAHRIATMDPGNKPVILTGKGEGFEDGPLSTAQFANPRGLALDAGGTIYVADSYNNSIRAIAGGQVTTLAGDGTADLVDGPVQFARFHRPNGIDVGPDGTIYVADYSNHAVRAIAGGQVTTLAGDGESGYLDGAAKSARFYYPTDVVVAPDGTVYVADQYNNVIRAIAGGQVTTFAGTGTVGFKDDTLLLARFKYPRGLALDSTGALYVADTGNHAIRLIAGNSVRTLAGTGFSGLQDGPLLKAQFNQPTDLAVDASGAVYVADSANDRIRVLRLK